MRNVKSYNDIPNIHPEEIIKFQEHKKSEICTRLDSNWKMIMKEQIENELNRRVKDALDTPPLERMRRHKQEALSKKNQLEDFKKNLNSHINFDVKDKIRFYDNNSTYTRSTDPSEDKIENTSHETLEKIPILSENNKFEYWLKPPYEPQISTNKTNIFKSNFTENTMTQEESKASRKILKTLKHFDSLTQKEKEIYFSTFTKDGFEKAMTTGLLPDGNKLEALHNGSYRDKHGILRNRDGPFWPKDNGPLHPVPHHKRIHCKEEPLLDPINENESLEIPQTQCQYTGIWKRTQIVYDTETCPRDQIPFNHADSICPGLIFESRFESGNLRQVRRVGQFEYELVLNNDLYTNRHTQWFYFRIRNMVKYVTYKFVIINFLKQSSLYTKGMRMLLYSEKSAIEDNKGWYRTGNNIRYSRNVSRMQSSLLSSNMAYFQLEFLLEFPHSNDSCYLSHCYPYTFTDLKNDLTNYQIDNQMEPVLRKEVLCETRLGNSCFLLTLTDKNVPDYTKLGVVMTARVHPGETNASWMMHGLIQYLISDCEIAKDLRKRIIFKIIPMLNPDGVIVGNYRCSMAGKDLNRNYRCPKEEVFPTIYHTKKVVENLKEICTDVMLYCDLHGHSRKHNVFMYGCDSQYLNTKDIDNICLVLNLNTIQSFVKDRIFPFLMQRTGPNLFSFIGCDFKISKCKESTGRVVMWKQFNIAESYTLETAFSGTDLDNRRHFNTVDLENVGKIFSESLSIYLNMREDEKMEKEIELELLKTVLKQMVSKNKQIFNLFKELIFNNASISDSQEIITREKLNHLTSTVSNFKIKEMNINVESFIDNLQLNDINQLDFISFDISDMEEENSLSSDSDIESETEENFEMESISPIPIKRNTKRFNQSSVREQKEIPARKPVTKNINSKTLPLIKKTRNIVTSPEIILIEKNVKAKIMPKSPPFGQFQIFLNRYEGRSNRGIPCFAEERILERSRRKSLCSTKIDIPNSLFKIPLDNINKITKTSSHKNNRIITLFESTDNTTEPCQKLLKQTDEMLYNIYQNNNDKGTAGNIEEQILRKPVLSVNKFRAVSTYSSTQQVPLKVRGDRESRSMNYEPFNTNSKGEAKNKFNRNVIQLKRKPII